MSVRHITEQRHHPGLILLPILLIRSYLHPCYKMNINAVIRLMSLLSLWMRTGEGKCILALITNVCLFFLYGGYYRDLVSVLHHKCT